MTNSNSTEFTASEGRKFAFPVGAAFLALSGILFWRDKAMAFQVTMALGTALWVLGLIIPRHLGPVYRGWMKMALMISKVTTPIFMGVVYFVVLTPTGFVMKALGRRPMRHSGDGGTFWHANAERPKSDIRRQF